MKTAEIVAVSHSSPNDTYIYKILPIGVGLVSISSDDSLRVIDFKTLRQLDGYHSLHDGITALVALGHQGVLTAGRDGVVKTTDLRSHKTIPLLSPRGLL